MTEPELAQELSTRIDGLVAQGLTLPIYVAAVAANGSMLTGMFEADSASGGLACEVWWTRELPSMAPPLVVTYVDPTGRHATSHLTWTDEEAPPVP